MRAKGAGVRQIRTLLMCALPLLVLGKAAGADAQAVSPRPIRHLSFAVSYAATKKLETSTTGLTGEGPSVPIRATATTTVDKGDSTLEVDVIAATRDGGLVVDAQVLGPNRKAGKTRFGITADGRLLYDPKAPVLEEETRMLFLLSQGVFAREMGPGTTWHEPIAGRDANGDTEYHILKLDGDRITAEINRSLTVAGAKPYRETSRLLTDYDRHFVTPKTAEVSIHAQSSPGIGQTLYVDTEINFKLTADTMGWKI